MEVTYCSTYRDLNRCTVYGLTHRREVIFLLIFLIVMGSYANMGSVAHLSWQQFPPAAFKTTTHMFLIIAVALQVTILFRLLKLIEQRQCTTILTEECLTDKTVDKTKRFPWLTISKLRYHQGDIYFWPTGKDGIFVPRSAFADTLQSQLFYETAVNFWNAAKSGQNFSSVQDSTIWPPAPRL